MRWIEFADSEDIRLVNLKGITLFDAYIRSLHVTAGCSKATKENMFVTLLSSVG